ncbi:hypothetical protein P8629_01195 [Hydrogenovibrio sp. 3SP14C1]|uniref:hypothetical protein n=1 Tax=Hydrogenovibrio sp. 3SP14C1 TaxID=3038774 RepID=UPI002416B512|nr:hypothetical protein [Hydrogenovibrio sp. 3SP14C1]MDG4811610.1 hypothetical protein [Hydrogenovibrio sp. 3SP14C1]
MTKLKISFMMIILSALAACGGTNTVQPSSTAKLPIDSKIQNMSISKIIKVKQGPMVSQSALVECQLPSQFPQLLKQKAADDNINVTLVDQLNKDAKGYQLAAEFTQIMSAGNAFIGHRKYSQIHLTLYKDGKKLSESDLGRYSGGGMFAGFKGSCSVLRRTVEANAQDAVVWLNSPVDGAKMGDMN